MTTGSALVTVAGSENSSELSREFLGANAGEFQEHTFNSQMGFARSVSSGTSAEERELPARRNCGL